MFVNQLSPGDRMSLKGKIFELQKKLNLLDVEQQHQEDFSFHPEITRYKLPNRREDFINSLNQAEESRKDRFEALKKNITDERLQDCTFSPQINRRKRDTDAKEPKKPVYIRLVEKGKDYHNSAEKRKELSKSYDADGRRLFYPSSSQKPQVEKGNMQVEEYLYRDAKDRVEKMDMKREKDKIAKERVASKQKMNKHSAVLVKRKCEREARELFDRVLHYGKSTSDNDDDGSMKVHQNVEFSHFQKATVAMLNFFDNHKDTLSFRNSVSRASSPYEVADKVWRVLCSEEKGEIDLEEFLSIVIPVMATSGNAEVKVKEDSNNIERKILPSEANLLLEYSRAALFYFSKKNKTDENETKQKNKKRINNKATVGKMAESAQDASVASNDNHTADGTDMTDDTSVQDSLKSYQEKAALSRRIQNYNKVLTERELMTNNKLEMLRENLFQKEMEECTFQPRITSRAQKMKEKEMVHDDQSIESTSHSKVYDRLYANKDTIPRSIAEQKHEPTADRGLSECTFVPNLLRDNHSKQRDHNDAETHHRRESRMEKDMAKFFGDLEMSSGNQKIFNRSEKRGGKSSKSNDNNTPRGYSDSIKRIREAAQSRKKKADEDEAFFAVNEERYNKGLQMMAEGPKPFRFRTEERHNEKEKMFAEVMQSQECNDFSKYKMHQSIDDEKGSDNRPEGIPPDALESIRGKTKLIDGELKPIRLHVDIKLGGTKHSHIAVADYDIPIILARDFCKIYGLDPSAEQVLAQVVESNMLANDIPIGCLTGDRMQHKRRSIAESRNMSTASTNNPDFEDDFDYQFYEQSSPQESSMPIYDHPF